MWLLLRLCTIPSAHSVPEGCCFRSIPQEPRVNTFSRGGGGLSISARLARCGRAAGASHVACRLPEHPQTPHVPQVTEKAVPQVALFSELQQDCLRSFATRNAPMTTERLAASGFSNCAHHQHQLNEHTAHIMLPSRSAPRQALIRNIREACEVCKVCSKHKQTVGH